MRVLLQIPKNPPPQLQGNQFTRPFKEFIEMCLQKDPANRPTAKELLKHQFIRRAKRTGYLTELIERYRDWKRDRALRGDQSLNSGSDQSDQSSSDDENDVNSGRHDYLNDGNGWVETIKDNKKKPHFLQNVSNNISSNNEDEDNEDDDDDDRNSNVQFQSRFTPQPSNVAKNVTQQQELSDGMNKLKIVNQANNDSNFFLSEPNKTQSNLSSSASNIQSQPIRQVRQERPLSFYQQQSPNQSVLPQRRESVSPPPQQPAQSIGTSNLAKPIPISNNGQRSSSFQKFIPPAPLGSSIPSSNRPQADSNKSSKVIFQVLNQLSNKYGQSEKLLDDLQMSFMYLDQNSPNSMDVFLKNILAILQNKNLNQSTVLSQYGLMNYSGSSNK